MMIFKVGLWLLLTSFINEIILMDYFFGLMFTNSVLNVILMSYWFLFNYVFFLSKNILGLKSELWMIPIISIRQLFFDFFINWSQIMIDIYRSRLSKWLPFMIRFICLRGEIMGRSSKYYARLIKNRKGRLISELAFLINFRLLELRLWVKFGCMLSCIHALADTGFFSNWLTFKLCIIMWLVKFI